MTSARCTTALRRSTMAVSAFALALSLGLVIAAPAAAQDTTKPVNADSVAKAAAEAAAAKDACNKLKDYGKRVAADSIKASWTAGTLFSADDSTSKQMRPIMPRLTIDSTTVPDSMRATAKTAGSSCRAAPNSQTMQQLVQAQLSAPRPLIGVQFQSVTAKDTVGFGLPNTHGLLVMEVTPGAPAATAGVAKGDIIIGLDGKQLATINQFMQRASQWKDGQKIKLEIVHPGGKHDTLEMTPKQK